MIALLNISLASLLPSDLILIIIQLSQHGTDVSSQGQLLKCEEINVTRHLLYLGGKNNIYIRQLKSRDSYWNYKYRIDLI